MKSFLFTLMMIQGCATAAFTQSVWTPANMIHYKRVSSPVISNDGRLVAYVVTTPRMKGDTSNFLSHIHVVNTDTKQGSQLTFGDKSCTNPRFSPDGQYLSFTSTRGKEGHNQLYLRRLSGGETWPITLPKGDVDAYKWSPDGKRIAYTMSDLPSTSQQKDRRERRDWEVVDDFTSAHLYTLSLSPKAEGAYPSKRLTQGRFHVTDFDFSFDGRSLVFSHQPTSSENDYRDISLVSTDSGQVQQLVSGKGIDHSPLYSPDGRWIAFVSDGNNLTRGDLDKWAVYLMPSGGGPTRKLALTPDENPTLLGWTSDNRSVVVSEALGTRTGLYLLPVTGEAMRSLPIPDKGITQGHNLNDKGQLSYIFQTPEIPAEVCMSSLTQLTNRQLTNRQLTNRQLTTIHTDYTHSKNAPSPTEVISWKTKDGKHSIEGLLTYPVNYQKGRSYPLLVNIHGGPAVAFGQTYTGASSVYPIQAFSQQGYFVLRPNPRGSTGYGASFRAATYRGWGEGDYQDVMEGVDKVIQSGLIHPDSLVVTGWSYGGYLTATIITKTNRFKAAMAGAAITNLISYAGTSDIPNYVPEYFGKEFWTDPVVFADHSPIFHISNAKTPTLIIHGLQDSRVAPEQGFQLYRALQRQNVPTQMVTYPRQYHAFNEPKFIQNVSERTIEWFNRYLGRKGLAVLQEADK